MYNNSIVLNQLTVTVIQLLFEVMKRKNNVNEDLEVSSYRIAGFFHGWKFSLFNFSWVDILAFGATLHRICIVEEILVELILAL